MQEKSVNFIYKLFIPIAIIVGCAVLGGFYYMAESNKLKSAEQRQDATMQSSADSDAANELFGNNLKCQALLYDLQKRWGNVTGIFFDKEQSGCIVRYTLPDGTTEEAPLEKMRDTNIN